MKGYRMFFVFFVLAFYSFGAGVMDSFAIYHSWLFVGEAEFANMHQKITPRIVSLFVMPLLICTICNVLLAWYRPASLPKRLVWAAFACLMIIWLSSVFIQIPMQFQLDHGKDMALLNDLIFTDWIRNIAFFVFIGIVMNMGRICFLKPVIF